MTRIEFHTEHGIAEIFELTEGHDLQRLKERAIRLIVNANSITIRDKHSDTHVSIYLGIPRKEVK